MLADTVAPSEAIEFYPLREQPLQERSPAKCSFHLLNLQEGFYNLPPNTWQQVHIYLGISTSCHVFYPLYIQYLEILIQFSNLIGKSDHLHDLPLLKLPQLRVKNSVSLT